MKHPRSVVRLTTTADPITASVATYQWPTSGGGPGSRLPAETTDEKAAWENSTNGQVAQMLRTSTDKPASVNVTLGKRTGVGTQSWREWDNDTDSWKVALTDPIWPIAQRAWDRHIERDLPELIDLGLQAMQIAGRFVLVSYPVDENNKVRYYPVDEMGREVRHPNYASYTEQEWATARTKDMRVVEFLASAAYAEWAAGVDINGRWKTVAVRLGTVTYDSTAEAYALTTETSHKMLLPRWAYVFVISAGSSVGASPKPGWVQTAALEIGLYQKASNALLSAVGSQHPALVLAVPKQGSPYNPAELPDALFGHGLLSKELRTPRADGRTPTVSPGGYLGAKIAAAAQKVAQLGGTGVQVTPVIVEMDAEHIGDIRVLDLGKKVDKEALNVWREALSKLTSAASVVTDAFTGAGSASGFNRNIGDYTAEEVASDAKKRAQWIVDQIVDSIVARYLLAEQRFTLAEIGGVDGIVDASGLQPVKKLGAGEIAALVKAGAITPEGALTVLGIDPGFAPERTAAPVETSAEHAPTSGPSAPARPVRAAEPADDVVDVDGLVAEIVAAQTECITALDAALELQLTTAADRLGAVLRSKERDVARKAAIAGCANHDVIREIGRDRAMQLLELTAGLTPEESEKELALFDKTVAALAALWTRKGTAMWKRIRRAFVTYGLYDTVSDVPIDDTAIGDAVAAGALVIAAGARRLFRRLFDPAVSDTETTDLVKLAEGDPINISVHDISARTVTASAGGPVDAETVTTDVGSGVFTDTGPVATVLTSNGLQVIGYSWDYGTAEREQPAPWHVANSALGTVASRDEFDGFPGDHKGCLCGPIIPHYAYPPSPGTGG